MNDLPELRAPRDLERDRATLDLRLKSPKRSCEAQADHRHLPLFVSTDEPRLI